MTQRYIFLIFILLFFGSCSSSMQYLGQTSDATTKLDVYVDESSIELPYKIIGKGYLKTFYFLNRNTLQKKAIEKGKAVGADAVLIQEYYVPNTGTSINSRDATDAAGGTTVKTGNTVVQSIGSGGYNIIFLKYK